MSLSSQTLAYQFRSGDSLCHRMGAGWKMAGVCALCSAACIVKTVTGLTVLVGINLIGYGLARLKAVDLWRDIRAFLVQMAIVVALYMLRYGSAGLFSGFRTSLQILLFFMPGALFLRTTSSSQLMKTLRRILPERIAFFVFISFRFVPYFTREFTDIVMAQQLRGARVTTRSLINPRNWPDMFHCILIPLMIRALKTAEDAALSAEARGFGKRAGSCREEIE
ncbi:MAG: energy-coupling factor transporter transmembrane component T [Desulfobacterales bacterium]|nr:energy-coupling factor transporter transmembrane component T [Desulfobacterales bacterium]